MDLAGRLSVACLTALAIGGCEREGLASPDPDAPPMRVRRLLAEYAMLAADVCAEPEERRPMREARMSEIDRELVAAGREILARSGACAEQLQVTPLGFYPADLEVPPPAMALWRRWVGLAVARKDAEDQVEQARERRVGACTPSAELLTLCDVLDEQERIREALRRVLGG